MIPVVYQDGKESPFPDGNEFDINGSLRTDTVTATQSVNGGPVDPSKFGGDGIQMDSTSKTTFAMQNTGSGSRFIFLLTEGQITQNLSFDPTETNYAAHQANITIDSPTDTDHNIIGVSVTVGTLNGNTKNYTGSQVGNAFLMAHNGTGTVGVIGQSGIFGVSGAINNNESGIIAECAGTLGMITNTNAGTITVGSGIAGQVANQGTGTISTGAGVTVISPENSGGGVIGRVYGIWVQDNSGVGSERSWNLLSEGAESENVFEGRVGVGGAPQPDTQLYIKNNKTPVINAATFDGNGLNDLTSGGSYNSTTVPYTYSIRIDSIKIETMAPTDTFSWYKDGILQASSVAMTGASQNLDNGVTVTFAAISGHTLNDSWEITITVSRAMYVVDSLGDPILTVLDSGAVVFRNGSGGFEMILSQAGAGIFSYGDIGGIGNHSLVRINDSLKTFEVILSGDAYLGLDETNKAYSFGDFNSINNGTYVDVDDANKTINLVGNTNISAGQKIKRTAVNSDYTISESDYLVAVTDTSSARTIHLPPVASISPNSQFEVKDESGGSGTHNITIDPDGSELIDGQLTYSISRNYGSANIYTNGSAWFIK